MNRFDETRKLKHRLNDVHIELAEKGLIKSAKLKGQAKVVYLYNRYKRVTAIAASIAGITALAISGLFIYLSPAKQKGEIEFLSGEIKAIKNQSRQQTKEINNIKENIKVSPATTITYRTGGTGFLIDSKGYIVTNAHVVEGAHNVAVQNAGGTEFTVRVVYTDVQRDLAILKVEDNTFKVQAPIPYSIKKASADIAEPIYTLGYPQRTDIVYGEGYLAAKTGFDGDTLTCQISIAANPGNSGGPIINRNGEVIGILSARQLSAEGAVFATQSKYIYNALKQLQKDTTYQKIKLPATSSLKGADRMQQVKKISDYVYMVKVN